jgi:hypothetical protein
MRYCVAHYEYFLDFVGQIIPAEMTERIGCRTSFLV